jgi:hypothetical protein
MNADSSIRVDLTAATEKLISRDWPGLKAGNQLTLRVIELREGGRALVDIGRFRALAEVTFPVAAGDELVVRVLDTQGSLRMAVVQNPLPKEQPPAQWSEPLRAFADKSMQQVHLRLDQTLTSLDRLPKGESAGAGLGEVLADLRSFLAALRPESGSEGMAIRVQSISEDCGIFFEKHLEAALRQAAAEDGSAAPEGLSEHPLVRRILTQDLKARLSAVKHICEQAGFGSSTREAAGLARSIDRLLADIVHQQQEIGRRRDASGPFQMIHFSLPLEPAAGKARLKIGFPVSRGVRSRKGFRAALLLELDRLGATRVDLFMLDRSLTATFSVKTVEGKALLESNAHEIRTALEPFFNHVQVKVCVSEKKIAQFEFEDLQSRPAGLLDVRI